MGEQLYLFEIFIDNIFFEECVIDVPAKKQIVISIKLGNIVTLEIRSDTLPHTGEGAIKRHVEFRSGRSYLCSLSTKDLMETVQKHPLEITVGVRGDLKPIGSSSAPWDDSIQEMVVASDDPTAFVTPVAIFDNFCLLDNGVIKGNVQMLFRVSCFGKSIQTQYEVLQDSGNKQFIFKSPNVATTFVCSKYGAGTSSDFIPVGPVFNASTLRTEIYDKTANVKSASWTALMESFTSYGPRFSIQSECLFPEYLNITPPIKDSAMTFDIMSIRARPEEEKFIDFLTGRKAGEASGSISFEGVGAAEKRREIPTNNEEHSNDPRDKKLNGQRDATLNQTKKIENTRFRLRGGGLTDTSRNFRLRGGAPSKSPIAECKEIMDKFDKILEEYRKALAPCGQVTCDHIPNITEAMCSRGCNATIDNNPNMSGCGLPECEYARYKKALMAKDFDIESQFIGPAILGNCGYPKCPYKSEQKNLPPIHWDCPEPLPKGKCKNPNCPYTQPICDLTTRGPCGSDCCPYAPPSPCSSPHCPFKLLPECAAVKHEEPKRETNKKETKSTCPFDNPPITLNFMQICDNPDCEGKKVLSSGDCGKKKIICESPNCPYKKQCGNPFCPFSESEINVCSNLSCPLRDTTSETCSNPNCPFAKSPNHEESPPNSPAVGAEENDKTGSNTSSSVCSNPECPFQKESKDSKGSIKEACANPECPYNVGSLESCTNPDCPFKTASPEDSKESCDNPECPFKRGSKISGESEESVCVCENPTCPSKRNTCPNPNCPFNLRGYGPCKNPNCPYKRYAHGKELDFCATPDASFNQYCADQTCPFHDRKLDEPEDAMTKLDVLKQNEYGRSLLKIGSRVIEEEGEPSYYSGERPSSYDMTPCTLKTCKFMGGHIPCAECGVGTDGGKGGPCPLTCPGEPICPLATAKMSKRVTRRVEPSYKRTCVKIRKLKLQDPGYPGLKIGHKECVMPYFFVPPKMGWLWNIHTPCLNLRPRKGWRPGAITRSVARAIMKHKKAQTLTRHENNKKKRKRKNNDDDSETELICPKPTLEVKKREGMYYITMNPLKDPKTLQTNENPYLDCTPMKFRVAKNNILDPDTVCGDEGEMYKFDSSSNSEIDIEITTPAGIIHPDRPVIVRDVRTKMTQYSPKDCYRPPDKNDKEAKEKNKERESMKTAVVKDKKEDKVKKIKN